MTKTFVAAAVLALGMAVAIPYIGAAQDQPQAQGERVGPGGRGHGGPMGRGGRMGGPLGGGFPAVVRDLTDAQREQVKAIREKHADRIRPLVERARTAREALNNAVISGNTGNLQTLSIEVGNAETELTFAQAQVQSEIYNVLTAEQKQKLAERRKQMEERRGEMMKRRQQRTQ
ncbi:MAG: periplasmic heavy metal sensor [Acidobacteria bacterium]|nr:MAG: periplasmic heavy metal sensor [Acidobacteriota bacterium]